MFFSRSIVSFIDIFAAIFFYLNLFKFSKVNAFYEYYGQQPVQHQCPVRIHSKQIYQFFPPTTAREMQMTALNAEKLDGFGSESSNSYEQSISPLPNNTGILSSNNFSPNLFSKFKCQFVFLGAIDEHVQVIFHKFNLYTFKSNQGNTSSINLRCEEEDHVTAHVLVGTRMSKIYDFCGAELPPKLMSAKNLLTLEYVAKSLHGGISKSGSDYGFVIEYRFLLDYGLQPKEAIQTNSENCTFIFNNTVKASGNFWSPNYPGFYPRNLNCQYIFYGQEGQIIFITFEYFDVEGFGMCEESTHSDFVLFSNYKTMDRTNRRYCGSNQPSQATIESESNYFRMQFRTNDIFDGTGFYAHYQFYDQALQQNRMKLVSSLAQRIVTSWQIFFIGFISNILLIMQYPK